ncbi:F0F1 ATP synthase subunit B' [Helicobacter cetorum]|uniref:F0F1 ATP synthase subunit B n=1 Tax=Helicobacter cetorum (strain ATCC BAA-429 / MIT 00-7128) TaxID=182217 RepID=I0EPS4_HELC0|nr:F0F1 ATP synthase subunit B' [Helicobacter cetorum]AFI04943.1 F0F1 ATP synthase subunit B' [Helicobacter cetorum MIT 00-7128]
MNITINPYLMALVFVVFVLLLWAMNAWVYKPLLAFMDNREAEINDSLSKIESDNKQSTQIQSQIEDLLKDANEQRRAIIAQATKQAIEAYDAIIAQKESELEQEFEDFSSQLKSEKQVLKEQLKGKLEVFETELNKRMVV